MCNDYGFFALLASAGNMRGSFFFNFSFRLPVLSQNCGVDVN
jgi:hypothetical protein